MSTLFMVQLGARPKGRLIEQHDMFFGVAQKVGDLIPAINTHWPEVKDKWHIDSYRAVTNVEGTDGKRYYISWQAEDEKLSKAEDEQSTDKSQELKLYFINLGGYQQGSIEEFHHKLLVVAPTQAAAMKHARQTEFYKMFSVNDPDSIINGASHIDDKMQVDVDEIYDVNGLLTSGSTIGRIVISPIDSAEIHCSQVREDKDYVGYLNIKKLKKLDRF